MIRHVCIYNLKFRYTLVEIPSTTTMHLYILMPGEVGVKVLNLIPSWILKILIFSPLQAVEFRVKLKLCHSTFSLRQLTE